MTNEASCPDPDAAAAHDFLSELRTRITTQPLPYQYGTRPAPWRACGKYLASPGGDEEQSGCAIFAEKVTQMLNVDLRPVYGEMASRARRGPARLARRRGCVRADLAAVQIKIREFAEVLQHMAYGSAKADPLTPPVMTPADLEKLCGHVRFGIDGMPGISTDDAAGINTAESTEVDARRFHHGIATHSAAMPSVSDYPAAASVRRPFAWASSRCCRAASTQRSRLSVDSVRRRLYRQFLDVETRHP